MLQVKITDFKSLDSFAKLQQQFKLEDFIYKQFSCEEYSDIIPKPEVELLKEDFCIQIQYPKEFTSDGLLISTTMKKIYFYEDFLPNKVGFFAQDYLNNLYLEIRSGLVDIPRVRKQFLYNSRAEINSIYESISCFDFLPLNFYNQVLEQLELLRGALESTELENDKTFAIGKIKIKQLKPSDLALLFHVLRAENAIEYYSDTELGSLLSMFFCSVDDGAPIELRNLGKILNNLKNDNAGSGKSIKRLTEIFKDIKL